METTKTRCKDCGYVHVWQAFKLASDPEALEWNRSRSTTCQECGSTNVENVEDDETMAPYRSMAGLLVSMAKNKAEGRPLTEGLHEGDRDDRVSADVAEATKDVRVVAHTATGHLCNDRKPSSGRKEKKMKVYVSGTSKRAELANEVMQRLQDAGHEITFDWTIDIPNEGDMDAEEMARRAEMAINAVKAADAVVLLITKEMRGVGSMVEIGVALGNDKVVLVAELEEGFNHFFSFHPNVWRAHSMTGVMKQLVAIEA
jgi:nucleoside 2-deoxyribosyltransferase